MAQKNQNELVEIGSFTSTHGLQGILNFYPLFESFEEIFKKLEIFNSKGEKIEIKLHSVKDPESKIMLKIKGVDAIEDAAVFVKQKLYVKKNELDKLIHDNLAEGEYLVVDLIGCKVIEDSGQAYGNITDVANYGSGDVMEITRVNHQKGTALEYYFLDDKEVFVKIDVKNKIIHINPPKE